ncbi:tetratricopeptide repeat protein [Desertibaculum subflavum]|uniref:tetratricopeptide repeat protein n=1 Tax=Desertibaculum subflavum TaxID=2268458 RepID=UPI0013C408CD
MRNHIFLSPNRRRAALLATIATVLVACAEVRETGTYLPGAKEAGGEPAALMRVADRTRAAGDVQTAIGLYRRVHELRPGEAEPLLKLGSALIEVGAHQEALDAFRVVLKFAPENQEALRGVGSAYVGLHLPRMAIEPLERIAEKQVDVRVESALGLAYDMLGDHMVARSRYQRGLSESPNHLGLRNNLGLSYALAGDMPAAISTLRGVVDTPGATVRHRQNLALVYGLAGEIENAAAVARLDLSESAVKANLAYYAVLRAQTPGERRNAIFGVTADPRTRK